MATPRTGRPRGRFSLFRGKTRHPITLTLTPKHHRQVAAAMRRLGLTRSDVIALLIDRFGDSVSLPPQS